MAEQSEIKQCQCQAIHLLTRMANLLNMWLEDMNRPEPGLGMLMADMQEHLNTQMSKPENTQLRDIVKGRINTIEQQIFDASVGKIRNMRAVETIRNTIHKNPAIRGVFLCEPPDIPETPLSKQVFNALEVMEVGEPGMAKGQLDKIYEELTCGA
jgi:hypothetical protein